MVSFIFQPDRQRNVRWFMDRYTEALARYPAARFCFVGHSNGTYLLASALQRYAACRFDTAVFAGSVVRSDFPWDKFHEQGRIRRFRNYVATADAVVAVLPGVFERFPPSWPGCDIGSSGHTGFLDKLGSRDAVEFLDGSHSVAVRSPNFDSIASFILADEGDKTEILIPGLVGKQAAWCVWLNKLNVIVWLLLLALGTTMTFVLATLLTCLLGIPMIASAIFSFLLIIALLQFV